MGLLAHQQDRYRATTTTQPTRAEHAFGGPAAEKASVGRPRPKDPQTVEAQFLDLDRRAAAAAGCAPRLSRLPPGNPSIRACERPLDRAIVKAFGGALEVAYPVPAGDGTSATILATAEVDANVVLSPPLRNATGTFSLFSRAAQMDGRGIAAKILFVPGATETAQREVTAWMKLRDEFFALRETAGRARIVYVPAGHRVVLITPTLAPGDIWSLETSVHAPMRPGLVAAVVAGLPALLRDLVKLHLSGAHRDLKAENMVLQYGAGQFAVGMIDHGNAKHGERTATDVVGTVEFLAPELRLGVSSEVPEHEVAPLDIWSLGMFLLTLMEGWNPLLESRNSTFLQRQRAALKKGYDAKFDADLKQRIEAAFGRLTPHYPALIPIIRSMLSLDPALRPTAAQLVERFSAPDLLTGDQRALRRSLVRDRLRPRRDEMRRQIASLHRALRSWRAAQQSSTGRGMKPARYPYTEAALWH